jgi:hypothetical protein
VQGSILGPFVYAIFLLPVFSIEDLSSFTDDTFIPRRNKFISELIRAIIKSLKAITKWSRQSGFKVHKTKMCFFVTQVARPITLQIDNVENESKNAMNVINPTK